MSDEINAAGNTETQPPGGELLTTEFDQGIDVNNLPAPPWTPANLGADFYKLAQICGAGDIQILRNPSLDPRSFGRGRANRIAELLGLKRAALPTDPNYKVLEEERQANIEMLYEEGERLQQKINAGLPTPQGTPRTPGAPAMGKGGVFRRLRAR